MVRELRERTGASLGKCRQALAEEAGDIERAVDWLRKRGIKSMEKRATDSAEALLALAVDASAGAIVELRAETDYVTRSALFQQLAAALASTAARLESAGQGAVTEAALLAAPLEHASQMRQLSEGADVATALLELGSVLGERLVLGRISRLRAPRGGALAAYAHPKFADGAPNSGKAAALVALAAVPPGRGEITSGLRAAAAQLARHTVAAQPRYISVEDISTTTLEHEREVILESHLSQLDEGRRAKAAADEEMLAKVVDGKMKRFYQDTVLLQQELISASLGDAKPPTVEQWLASKAKDLGVDAIVVEGLEVACL